MFEIFVVLIISAYIFVTILAGLHVLVAGIRLYREGPSAATESPTISEDEAISDDFLAKSCAHCAQLNWFYYGDPSDHSLPDPEGLICWSCGEITPLVPDELSENSHIVTGHRLHRTI